ncbi:MAG: DUF86 domain-containing protein [Phycisphaerae bacterium]|nr:DUF86 domain-containing protein [Phycisphaerae bacterium]
MPLEDDLIRLRHMLDAAEDAVGFAANRNRDDLDRDRMLLLSLVKCIEIIGEAASRVSPEMQMAVPKLPWQDIIGMRNRLIHAYFDVDHDRVWDTVEQDLPYMIAALRGYLQQERNRRGQEGKSADYTDCTD